MLKVTASVAAATWATGFSPLRANGAASDKKIPIGLQLYSVRKETAKDMAGTIAKVAKMGYSGVEFAGFFKHEAKDVRKMLDDNGIVCCGSHTQYKLLEDDKFDETMEYLKTIGCPYVIIPWLPEKMRNTTDEMKKTAEFFNKLVEKVKPYKGMEVGYHAHGYDFTKIDGKTIWDGIFENTSKDFVMQLDVGNCLAGGGNPYEVFKKYPGQMKTVHLKEYGGEEGAPVGEGEVDWKQIFKLCNTVGGTKWGVVEHEKSKTPMIAVEKCLENLRKMGY